MTHKSAGIVVRSSRQKNARLNVPRNRLVEGGAFVERQIRVVDAVGDRQHGEHQESPMDRAICP